MDEATWFFPAEAVAKTFFFYAAGITSLSA
jgi:hypothetical protein